MKTRSEEKKRERLSKINFTVSLMSLIPFAGAVFSIASLVTGIAGLNLARRFPERFGGLVRLRVSVFIALIGLVLSGAEFHTFFKIKLKQANNARCELTMMRLYEAAEAMERYGELNGTYPEGGSAAGIEEKLKQAGILCMPFKDGWEREMTVRSRMWDYSLTAMKSPKTAPKEFPVLKAQNPKPVFPYVGKPPASIDLPK